MPVNQTIDKRNKDIKIYINGSFFDRDDAKISVFDSGFLLGDGIWEGIRLVDNNWVFLDEHLDRLYEGCKAIDIEIFLTKDDIKIYINGSFFNRDDAKISVFDSGFLLGDGIWEGIRLVDNNWVFLDEHLNRLYEGCKAIDIEIFLSKDDIKKAIFETQNINNMTDSAHARLMITRGNKIKPFQQPSLSDGINFVIIMEHSEENSINDGINLVTVPQVRGLPMSQDPKLNSHSKLNCILACIQANKAGGDEALMLDPSGFVNTTNSCNFFIVKNKEVWTSTGDYCMNGITRLKVIELCKTNDITVHEKNFSLVDVYSAQESFISGTLGSLTQVLTIDGRYIGNKNVGWPITEKLRSLYKELIYV